jgi:hypothetical protein
MSGITKVSQDKDKDPNAVVQTLPAFQVSFELMLKEQKEAAKGGGA